MAEPKKSNKERLREITEGIEQGIKELFESEKYMKYLSTMSRFHRYSVNNTMLIYMQKPDATLVAGFNKWRDQFERHVKKGEHGITIIAPTPFKKKIEEQKLDPDTKAPMLDADGKVITEEKEIQIPMFKPVKVFDVSQTDGKPLPQLASNLTGDVQQFDAFMEALRRSAPVPIQFEAMNPEMDGYFNSTDQRIAIRIGMSEVQTVSATVHEIAHSKLHNPALSEARPEWKVVMVSDGGTMHDFSSGYETKGAAEQFAEENEWHFIDENDFEWRLEVEEDHSTVQFAEKTRKTEEVEAESISYAVCQYYGIQTGENSFGYIASWSQGKALTELRASLETINKTASGLITDIDRHFAEICKERGIDLTAQQEPIPETDSIEQFASDLYDYMDQLYQNGVMAHPYSLDSREQTVTDLAHELHHGEFGDTQDRLAYVSGMEGAPSAEALLYRLRKLERTREDGLEYLTHKNPRSENEQDAGFIQAYEKADGELIPREIIFVGSEEQCADLTEQLNEGLISYKDARAVGDLPLPTLKISTEEALPEAAPALETSAILNDAVCSKFSNWEKEIIQDYISTFGDTEEGQKALSNLVETARNNQSYVGAIIGMKVSVSLHKEMQELQPSEEIVKLATNIEQLVSDFYPNFRIESGSKETTIQDLSITIAKKDVEELREGLRLIMHSPGETAERAQVLLEQLNAIAPVTEKTAPEVSQPAEQLCVLDDSVYLHIQISDEGWDYTFYDKETMQALDGGNFERPELPISIAALQICTLHNMEAESIKLAPLSMIETLQNAAYQQLQEQRTEQEEVSGDLETPPTSMLPDAPEQALDEYPMPDETLGVADLEACGYLDGDMLPLSKERAMELYDMDLTVYAIVGGGSAEMLFDQEDFDTQAPGTVFALSREEWEESPMFHDKIMERHDHQQEREAAFLAHEGDCFAIYQVKHDDAQRDIRYEGLDWLKSIGRKVEHENYDLVYTAPLPAAPSVNAALAQLDYQFNNEHPVDYHHPSMSVSDIVAVKRDGAVSCHYYDSFGFQEIPGFLPQDNPLRNAEMSMEDDYGMIDGIINNGPKEPTVAQLEQQARSGQPISLMDLADAVHREQREKKKSVMEQLRNQPKQERKKTAPKRSAEREI